MALPRYRQVFVVSDLHLGGYTGRRDDTKDDWVPVPSKSGPLEPGERSFRIFRDAPALRYTILQAAKVEGPVALVLNGDIVDFLADANAALFDPEGALAKLQAIVNDPEQHVVWTALVAYLNTEAHDLVLVLGNHDIELGMSDVQEWLANFLTDGELTRRRRLVHCYDGEGFRCIVGGNLVQCVHGNAADPWNVVDYAQLAKVAEARRLHTNVPELKANTGTRLVVEHMNAVKRKYQWVDLLKPEREGAAAVVQAKDKARKAPIRQLASSITRHGMLKQLFIGEPGAAPIGPPETLRSHDDVVSSDQIEQWLSDAQQRDADGMSALELAEDDGMLESVFVVGRSIEGWLGKSLRELLLEGISSSKAWDLGEADDVFKGQDKLCHPDVDFLVAGHTHLERCLRRDRGRGVYYNSGTWIKLVRIPLAALRSDRAFALVDKALSEGSMEALERVEMEDGKVARLLQSIRTVVRIWADHAGASAALFHVNGDEKAGFELEEVAETRRSLDSRGLK